MLNLKERARLNITLQETRKKGGYTQVQVAKLVGISEISYQRIEYGTQRPNLDTAITIARTLNSTVEALFGAATPAIDETPDGNQANQ